MKLLINCISTISAAQILSITDEYTFHISNFLIIGLCNYSANCWPDIFSLLIPPPKADLSPSKADFLSKSL